VNQPGTGNGANGDGVEYRGVRGGTSGIKTLKRHQQKGDVTILQNKKKCREADSYDSDGGVRGQKRPRNGKKCLGALEMGRIMRRCR